MIFQMELIILKANGVSEGVKSYGKMVDLLLVYYNLFPYK